MMNNMKVNQLKAGALLSYLSMGLGYLVSIIYTPIMLRLLGQNDYGLYNLVASVVSYLSVLNFGFSSTYIRYFSKYKVKEDRDNIAKLNGMFFIIFSVIGLIAVIAGIILMFNTRLIFGDELTENELTKAKILMMILVVNLAISFLNLVFNTYITANEKFVFQKLVHMIKIIGNPFLTLPVLFMGYGAIGMAVATTILNIMIEFINASYCIRKMGMTFKFRNFDFKLMREMTVFSSYIFMNMVIDQINWNVDKYLLGRFHGTISVAVYGLAAHLNGYYLNIMNTISNVFIPRVHRMVADSNDNFILTKMFTRIGRLQLIILSLFLSGIVFFGRPFIHLWAGANYNGSYTILLILIISGVVPTIQTIGIEIQRAKNMHKFRSILYFIIALGNLCISIPLAKMYEGAGAALGTAVAIIIGNGFIMNWYYHYKVGIDIKYFWKNIFSFIPSLVVPILTGILINRFIDLYTPFNFICFAGVYVAAYCISIWFFGMNQYEKNLFKKPVLKIFQKIIAR